MGGHGYIAMGLLSLVPASIAIAYLAQDRRFRKGMAQSDAMRCWMCVGSTLSFPLTCGFIGQHKRLNTLFADEIALAKGGAESKSLGQILPDIAAPPLLDGHLISALAAGSGAAAAALRRPENEAWSKRGFDGEASAVEGADRGRGPESEFPRALSSAVPSLPITPLRGGGSSDPTRRDPIS
eukprot:CAMPEP_0204160194 /NCGR_PEP_ID=MMETSP0361-20130328/33659_1 /ASSEMBLY_ACC=CAM_ASM_000343 /TAXON_ID=268821 /ORGANISM="Scrippsiella Hangoei, Strain SHTV-5" /LENGTH=181 /DNA_ID=CAMNT_0051116425 /DNA_START=22 /DNA_END=562 /DNA_ORIENTATION=+